MKSNQMHNTDVNLQNKWNVKSFASPLATSRALSLKYLSPLIVLSSFLYIGRCVWRSSFLCS
jgi:hypothetical protein